MCCMRSFNPRAPCGARRVLTARMRHSSRFNPRAPCGARLGVDDALLDLGEFQSTRPVRGATPLNELLWRRAGFQSTRPVRGATPLRAPQVQGSCVSIHAPRAGRDLWEREAMHRARGFNPRAPCGARPWDCGSSISPRVFQSTRPVRGATAAAHALETEEAFQSTRPVRGATSAVR